jgi:hypothetical protein
MMLFIFSSKLGTYDFSLNIRLETAAGYTAWQSDSACSIKTPSTYFHRMRLLTSFACDVVVHSLELLADSQSVTNLVPKAIPTTGSSKISLFGTQFSTFGTSETMRFQDTVHKTALLWISDSTMVARIPDRFDVSLVMALFCVQTVLNLSTISPNLVDQTTHFSIESTGSFQIHTLGMHLKPSSSYNLRLSYTACQSSEWISESTISCKAASVSSDIHAIVLSHSDSSLAIS